ncbi:MAG: GIY-YIG nuclease family protein [Rhodobacterales bacterium]|nr:GIY-YIG nuclease family protein [Rhodobacterales bacterium]
MTSAPLSVDDAETLPAGPGAYALAIALYAPMRLVRPRGAAWDLEPGWYVYAGSARGPGGIRARVRRHLKAAKTPRWHVDRLTNAGGVALVLALPGGTECAVAEALLSRAGATQPAPGFGSSDCAACRSHLLSLGEDLDLDGVATLWTEAGLAGLAVGAPAVSWRRPPAACFWRPPPGLVPGPVTGR